MREGQDWPNTGVYHALCLPTLTLGRFHPALALDSLGGQEGPLPTCWSQPPGGAPIPELGKTNRFC